MKKIIWIAALLGLSQLAWGTTTFVTIPLDGAIIGQPDTTIGWGFTIVNDVAGQYVVITETDFTQLTGPGIGSYLDIVATNYFFPVGPATTTTWTQNYDGTIPTGVGSFTINPAVAYGTLITGTITVKYDVYSDPLATVLVSTGNTFTPMDVSILVVPEPGTLGLAAGALFVLGALRRKQRLRVRSENG